LAGSSTGRGVAGTAAGTDELAWAPAEAVMKASSDLVRAGRGGGSSCLMSAEGTLPFTSVVEIEPLVASAKRLGA
jgi:hypothetical protein